MARSCVICSRANRAEIDDLLLRGQSLRSVAERFGLSLTSTKRHKDLHLLQECATVIEVSVDSGTGVPVETVRSDYIRDLEIQKRRADHLGRKAEADHKLSTALQAIKVYADLVDKQAKLKGLIQDQSIVIVNNPVFAQYNLLVMDALEPFPEARQAVIANLEEVLRERIALQAD